MNKDVAIQNVSEADPTQQQLRMLQEALKQLRQRFEEVSREISTYTGRILQAGEWAEMLNKRMTVMERLTTSMQQGMLTTDELTAFRDFLREIKE